MNYPYFLLLSILSFFFTLPWWSTPQQSSTIEKADKDTWAQLDSLRDIRQSKTLYDKSEAIYKNALEEKNHAIALKALNYKFLARAFREENATQKNFEELNQLINSSEFPLNQVAASLQANLLQMHYQNNRYKIDQRVETTSEKGDQLDFWTKGNYQKSIKDLHLMAIGQAKKLDDIDSKPYQILFNSNESNNQEFLSSSLYQVIFQRAFDYFNSAEFEDINPKLDSLLGSEILFANIADFQKIKLSKKQLLTQHTGTVFLLNEMFDFLMQETERNEILLCHYNAERFKWASAHSLREDKDSLQLLALLDYTSTLKSPQAKNIWNAGIAKFYQKLSNEGEAFEQEEKIKFRKKALFIADSLLTKKDTAYWKNNVQRLRNEILEESFSAELPEHSFPGSPNLLKVNYRNKDEIHWQIFSVKDWDTESRYYDKSEVLKQLSKAENLHQGNIQLKGSSDYFPHSMEFELPALASGNYLLLLRDSSSVSDTSQMHLMYFNSTNLAVVHRKNSKSEALEWVVREAKSGKALKGAEIQVYFREYDYKSRKRIYKKGPTLKTNSDGLASWLPGDKNLGSIYIDVQYENETLEKLGSYYSYRKSQPSNRPSIQIFTDRSIYRPGQNVHFKAIGLENSGDEKSLKTNWKETFRFKDANYQEVEKLELTSDDFGSFSGTFQIPESGLNGNYRIETIYGSQVIKVEAYQRPKFELELLPLEGFVKLGDSILVKGTAKTFAGVALQDAELKYSVELLPQYRPYYSRIYPPNKGREISSGTLKIDDKGNFDFTFLTKNNGKENRQNYLVKVTATDITGETQEAERNYYLTNEPFQISSDISEKIYKNKTEPWKIQTSNSSGQNVTTSGSINVYALKTPEKVLLDRSGTKAEFSALSKNEFEKNWPYLAYADENNMENWAITQTVFEANIETDTLLNPEFLKSIAAGAYKVEIKLNGESTETVTQTKYFSVFDLEKLKMPYPMPSFFKLSENNAEVGNSIDLTIGTGFKNAEFELLIMHKNGEERSLIKVGNELKNISIPIKKEYEGGISVAVYMLQYGRTFSYFSNISVPFENKKLSLELESMRKVLRPGSEEEWTISIKDENGKAVEASLLASMYDASLDKIYSHSWYFNPLPRYSFNSYAWGDASGLSRNRLFADMMFNNRIPYPNLKQPIIPDFEFFWGGNFGYRSRGDVMYESVEMDMNEEAAAPMQAKMSKRGGDSDKVGLAEHAEDLDTAIDEKNKEEESVKMRSNFAETAFFFPQLVSDNTGQSQFKFTLPDVITRWKFQALAHSKDLQFGQLTEYFEARKELMIEAQPLVFLRQGDSISFEAKITNMGAETLIVNANLQWLNPFTQEDLSPSFIKENANKSIEIPANEVRNVNWQVKVPSDFDQPLMYRIKATSNGFSDGEEKMLPILENNIALTKSIAFQLDENQEKTFSTGKLLDLPEEAHITEIQMEINPNPHWYVIQALPYLAESNYQGSDAIFNRLYAQSISAALANRSPEIKLLFDQWHNRLKSPLQRNEEKAISELNNTPWLRDALKDEKRMKDLSQLFDVNLLEYEKTRSIRELLEMQSPNGGWPWIKSMPDSRFITQKIVLGLSRLNEKNLLELNSQDKLKAGVQKSIKYLDREMLEDYERILKLKEKSQADNQLDAQNIQYLLLRSSFENIPLNGKSKEAHDYFLNQANKYWNQFSLMLQAQIALVLHRNDKNETAKMIVEAFKQNSINNAELGRYWKTSRNPYWYHSPIEMQVAILEAIYEIEGKSPIISEMQKWLLNEKRTNNWGNASATADACYAFLLDNEQKWIQENKTEAILNGQNISPEKTMNDGSGTLVFTWKGADALKKFKGDLKIINAQENLIWGSVSISFESPLEAVEGYGDELSVVKEIFVKSGSSSKEKLKSIDEANPLVGNELWVRLKIEAKRNFDYVQLQDLRAAGSTSKNILSGNKWEGGLRFYQQNNDASMQFFIPNLQKGSYIIEYPLYVSSSGRFSSGPAQIQCAYATEFEGYSDGMILKSGK